MTSDELDPQEETVRRLLAEAGKDPGTVPDDVVARLDDTLAGLVAERADGAEPSPAAATAPTAVSGLAERRRRRWPRVLVAAAAVSVISIGAANLFSGGEADLSTAGDAGGAALESAPEDSTRESPGDGQAAAPQEALPNSDSATRSRPALRTESLTTDIQRIEDFRLAPPALQFREPRVTSGRPCATPKAARGDNLLLVQLDGEPSVLVLRKPVGDERLAEVFSCDDPASPVATTTVRTR